MIKHHSLEQILSDAEVFIDGDWVESKDQDPGGNVRLTQLADVGDGFWIDKSNRYMTEEKADELKCTYLKQGDLLVARMPDPIGRCCEYPGGPTPAVTVVDVCVIRPNKNKVFPRFLMHALNAPVFRHQILKHVTGTTRQRISRGNLKKLEIPLPPLAEQKRIAAILDKADAIRRKLQQSLRLSDDFLRSVFLDMFGDPVTNPKGWKEMELQELGKISTGTTPSSKLQNMFDGSIPFITPGDLKEGWISTKRTVTEQGAKQSRTVRKGATLVCCIGATIGKMGKATQVSAFNQQINAVEWDKQVSDSFGIEVLKFFKSRIADQGMSTTLPILNKSAFQRLVIPVPPVSDQDKFANIVDSIERHASKLIAQLADSEALFSSLQQRAFRGEL